MESEKYEKDAMTDSMTISGAIINAKRQEKDGFAGEETRKEAMLASRPAIKKTQLITT